MDKTLDKTIRLQLEINDPGKLMSSCKIDLETKKVQKDLSLKEKLDKDIKSTIPVRKLEKPTEIAGVRG
jgi:hypothetical protein